jgi:hypothetical protein
MASGSLTVLAEVLLSRLPTQFQGAITPRQAAELIESYPGQDANTDLAVAPSPIAAGARPSDQSPPDLADALGLTSRQTAEHAFRVQFVLWRDARCLYDGVLERLELSGTSRDDAYALLRPDDQDGQYDETRFAPAALSAILYGRLPAEDRAALSPGQAFELMQGYLRQLAGPASGGSDPSTRPEDLALARDGDGDGDPHHGTARAEAAAARSAQLAVPLAVRLQAERCRNYQAIYDDIVARLVETEMAPEEAVDLVRPRDTPSGHSGTVRPRTDYAETRRR